MEPDLVHDMKESVQPLVSDGMIPRSQWCIATQHMGQKSGKELLFLASFPHVLFYRLYKYAHRLKCHDTDKQAQLYPSTRGYPGYG
jgi:hypothetical protein